SSVGTCFGARTRGRARLRAVRFPGPRPRGSGGYRDGSHRRRRLAAARRRDGGRARRRDRGRDARSASRCSRHRVTRLVLIRHAEPEASVHGRVYGALDVALSKRGLHEAKKLASTVRGLALDAVYASPLRRAVETAIPLARERGLELTLHEGLREVDFGELEGRTYEEIGEDHADLFRAWATNPSAIRFPGGEDYVGLKARVLTAVEEIRERTTSAAIVAHGGVNRVVLADALGLP